MVDVGARGDRDHARETAGKCPERIALAGDPPAGEAAREPEGDDHRDRAQGRRREVDVEPAREDRRLDEEAGGVEAVEAGEDQHQTHEGQMRVVRSEGSRPPLTVVLPYAWPEVQEHSEREGPCDAVDDERGDRVVEAVVGREPAARAPAPGRVHDPDAGSEHDGEDEVRGQADALDERTRHDRGSRPGEEQEREEEDEAQMACEARLEVPAHAGAPRRCEAAESRELGRAGMSFGGAAVLEAAVDVPAEVVEARRDDGDGEDVLHRRRHDVLAPRDARFVRHEADVDQPHDHDREEVEDLEQDQRIEVDLLLKLLGVGA